MACSQAGSGLLSNGCCRAITSNQWYMEEEFGVGFQEHGLSSIEFDILATMRRSDTVVTPTELYQTLMLSSGAVSTRIEQLVKRGFVQRIASEEDRRSCKVTLTQRELSWWTQH